MSLTDKALGNQRMGTDGLETGYLTDKGLKIRNGHVDPLVRIPLIEMP